MKAFEFPFEQSKASKKGPRKFGLPSPLDAFNVATNLPADTVQADSLPAKPLPTESSKASELAVEPSNRFFNRDTAIRGLRYAGIALSVLVPIAIIVVMILILLKKNTDGTNGNGRGVCGAAQVASVLPQHFDCRTTSYSRDGSAKYDFYKIMRFYAPINATHWENGHAIGVKESVPNLKTSMRSSETATHPCVVSDSDASVDSLAKMGYVPVAEVIFEANDFTTEEMQLTVRTDTPTVTKMLNIATLSITSRHVINALRSLVFIATDNKKFSPSQPCDDKKSKKRAYDHNLRFVKHLLLGEDETSIQQLVQRMGETVDIIAPYHKSSSQQCSTFTDLSPVCAPTTKNEGPTWLRSDNEFAPSSDRNRHAEDVPSGSASTDRGTGEQDEGDIFHTVWRLPGAS